MKHVQLFEQFITEKVNKKDLKNVLKHGFDAKLEDGAISIEGMDINPWGDGHEYTFYWDGTSVWAESDMSSAEYEGDVNTADEFTDVIYQSDGWQ